MTDNLFLKRAYRLRNQHDTLFMCGDYAATYDQSMKITVIDRRGALLRRASDTVQINPLPYLMQTAALVYPTRCWPSWTIQLMSDVSPEMIEIARQLSCVCRHLTCFKLDDPFPCTTGVYHVITAMGVFADKYTQPQIIGHWLDKLRSGSLLIFSLNNHTLESPDYLQVYHNAAAHGVADILEEDDGSHMVKLGMTSKL